MPGLAELGARWKAADGQPLRRRGEQSASVSMAVSQSRFGGLSPKSGSRTRCRPIGRAGATRAVIVVWENSPTALLAKRDAIVMWWETGWCGFCGVGPGTGGRWCEVETLSRRTFCCRALTELLELLRERFAC